MTMRREAIYPSIVVGIPPQEDAWLGKATERIFLPAIRMTVPEIVDYDLPVAGAFHNCVIVSIRKAFPGHARKVMHAIWGLGMLSLSKSVVVVDEFVDVHDYERGVLPRLREHRPEAGRRALRGPLDQLDHAADAFCLGGKLGIDATHKLPGEASASGPGGSRCPPKFVTWSTSAGPSTESTVMQPKTAAFPGDCAKSYVFDTTRPNQGESRVLVTAVDRDQGGPDLWPTNSTGRRTASSTTPADLTFPVPSIWPFGFALGVAFVLVGLIVHWLGGRDRRGHRDRLRLPLDPRGHARGARRGGTAPPRAAAADVAEEEDERKELHYTRNVFLGARRSASAPRSAGSSRSRCWGSPCARVRRPGVRPGRSRAARELPRGAVGVTKFISLRMSPRRRRAAPPTSATTASTTGSRASRSSRTAASTSAARAADRAHGGDGGDRDRGRHRRASQPSTRPASPARATAARTTSRATAPPARRSARSTATSTRSPDGNLVLGDALQRRLVEGEGAEAICTYWLRPGHPRGRP